MSFLSRDGMLFLDVLLALIVHAIYRKHEISPARTVPTVSLLILVPALPALLRTVQHIGAESDSDHQADSLPCSVALLLSFPTFYVTLLISISAYRVSPFHPLAQVPVPRLARLTKLWGAMTAASGRNHEVLRALHDRYGPYVRVGPNEVSCLDADAMPAIMGTDGMPKGPMWDARSLPSNLYPSPSGHPAEDAPRSLIALRSRSTHALRRRPWTRAFSPSAVRGYAPIVARRARQLVRALEAESGADGVGGGKVGKRVEVKGAVDLARWTMYFAVDVMGDMAFGGGFELMREGDREGIWHLLESGMRTITILQHVPWVMDVLWRLPVVVRNILRCQEFAIRHAMARKRRHEQEIVLGSERKDLFYHLMNDKSSSPHLADSTPDAAPSDAQLVTDAMLAIVAGSDTTATVLAQALFSLIAHPRALERLRGEVDEAFPEARREVDADDEDVDAELSDSAALAEMPYLNAVINEAMRLQPPVPSGSQRAPERGSGGKMVGPHFIPEGTAIFVPTYAMHTDPRYFSPSPDAFWPDRWLPPHLRDAPPDPAPPHARQAPPAPHHPHAFLPFSYGPAGCAGRPLALLEMRTVLALLVARFEMRFADGYDTREWERERRDWFVVRTGRLPVVLERRK